MALQTNVYDLEGKVSGKITLPKEFFGAKIKGVLLAQAVRVYLSNQRRARAHARTRGEVSGSTRKIYRQKGTGKARHGDIKAPVFVGGGKAHGPTGEQNYRKDMSKKMRQAALVNALSSKMKDDQILVLDELGGIKGKTRQLLKVLENLPIKKEGKRKFLLVLFQRVENISRAAKNIQNLKLAEVKNLNVYQVLNGGTLLFTKEAVNALNNEKHSGKADNN